MSNEQLNRFSLLSEKVLNTKASYNELKEFKELLSSLNSFVEFSLPQAFANSKDFNHSS
mgnify:FL=1